MDKISLETPICQIKRITPAYQKRLEKLGIKTAKDLLYHFPFRYEDFSKVIAIADVKLGEKATAQGKILDIKNSRTWRRRMFITEAIIEDKTSSIKAVWFNQPFLLKNIRKNDLVSISGKIHYDGKTLYFSNPAYEKISEKDQNLNTHLKHTARLVPIYPETRGLTSRWLRYVIKMLLDSFDNIPDFLPLEIIKAQKLLSLSAALKKIHFPDSEEEIVESRRRLSFEEIFLIQLFLGQQKMRWQKQKALVIPSSIELTQQFVKTLNFKLTDDQRVAAWEILKDLEKPRPMNRLLEGDVGSGKTVVAFIAALNTMCRGFQVALMAPTEVLAYQHFSVASKIFENFKINIGLLISAESKIIRHRQKNREIINLKKKEFLSLLKKGEIDFLIGTHALIQENIIFKNLVLSIIDEQHRFGVLQRAALQRKIKEIKDESPGLISHLLSMTATPIPRTLTLTIYGDLDLSLLKQMPEGRQKIITKIVAQTEREKTYQFIREEIKRGRQIFVICPLIEDSEKLEVKSVTKEYEKLSRNIFPEFKIMMLHGRQKTKEKEKIMRDFKEGKIDILVSTSVVEVGIDIANATVMMIEGADRFGLAQLYQFRGRVGRGEHQSYCFLFTESPAKKTWQRLKAVIEVKSGFELAEKDLKIRGPGEFYGTRQSGLSNLSMSSLADLNLVKAAREEAQKLLEDDFEIKNYSLLREKLKEFQSKIHLE